MAKLIKKEEPNLVWSDGQDLRKTKNKNKSETPIVPGEVTLRVRLEKKNRGGKTVTVIYELPDNEKYFKKLTKKLKAKCGCGGSFKGESIEIQGDRKEDIIKILEGEGFKAISSGG